MGAGLRCSCFRLPDFGGLRPRFFMVNLSGLPPFPTLVHPSGDSLGRGCCACWCCECACDAAAGAAAAAGGATGGAAAEVAAGTGCGWALPSLACCRLFLSHWDWGWMMY